MECALIPCKAYSTAEFAHGPKALADHGSAAIVFGESPDYLAENGCVTVSAPKSNQGPLDEIWQVIFGQWIALFTARARGLNPDQAQNLSKVTKTL
jgi:glucosamine--fructose-6-phosphate aminotransferase (isomerizing)